MDCSQGFLGQWCVGGTGKGSWFLRLATQNVLFFFSFDQLGRYFLQPLFHHCGLVFLFNFILNCAYLQSKY